MKTEIIGSTNKDIDWSKPQWVISSSNIIILTNGEHNAYTFSGTCLPYPVYPNGHYGNFKWYKEAFRPLEGELTIKISNED